MVDIASWIFPATKTTQCANKIVTLIKGPSPSLLRMIKAKLEEVLRVKDARVLLVFDGRCFHPKRATNQKRKLKLEAAREELEEFRRSLEGENALSTV